ncbi:conserved hypothetical protein [Ricinus communis]|uniref:Uncharacterized protein n=1 Tax=Ricinus communis TaxID=3988 RepID=B9S6I3_RICCO|nr:conserved hypothetical protein [Ricinus communis]
MVSSQRMNDSMSVPKLPKIPFLQSNRKDITISTIRDEPFINSATTFKETAKLYAILEAVADRVEMHRNIATGGAGVPLLALKLSSTLLFTAATAMLVTVDKTQPSQLADIQTTSALHDPTEMDVNDAIDKDLALAMLGKMIEKGS